jgi:hypothetical protein
MMYKKKKVTLPDGFTIGSTVYIAGEGGDEFIVDAIITDEDGDVTSISYTPYQGNEPLCKFCLKDEKVGIQSLQDKKNWVSCVIGACDGCQSYFQDACCYWTIDNKIYCRECRVQILKRGDTK